VSELTCVCVCLCLWFSSRRRFARLKAAILETRMLSVRRDYQELVEEYTLLGGPDFTKIVSGGRRERRGERQ